MRIIMYSVGFILIFIILAMLHDKNTNYKNICCKEDESEKEETDDSYIRL